MSVINRLIPADQLHFCEEDGRYYAISKHEAVEIDRKCEELNGCLTEEQRMAVIMWYQDHKTGTLLWDNFMKGRIMIKGVSKNGEPLFAPVEL